MIGVAIARYAWVSRSAGCREREINGPSIRADGAHPRQGRKRRTARLVCLLGSGFLRRESAHHLHTRKKFVGGKALALHITITDVQGAAVLVGPANDTGHFRSRAVYPEFADLGIEHQHREGAATATLSQTVINRLLQRKAVSSDVEPAAGQRTAQGRLCSRCRRGVAASRRVPEPAGWRALAPVQRRKARCLSAVR